MTKRFSLLRSTSGQETWLSDNTQKTFSWGLRVTRHSKISPNLDGMPPDLSSSMTTQIDEALDYRVKEFRVNKTNPGMNTRFWTKKDCPKARISCSLSKSIKTRCIIPESEAFVVDGFREGDYQRSIHFYRLSHSELDDIEKVAVCSSLRLLKTKNALLKHPSDTKVLTMKMEILLEPTSNKLLVGKYGDSDGYTFDDPILILEILSRRFLLRGIYLITGSSKVEKDIPHLSGVQFTTQCNT
ncbi:hypothetical protein Tco_0360732 [Tanacetum coccineum]